MRQTAIILMLLGTFTFGDQKPNPEESVRSRVLAALRDRQEKVKTAVFEFHIVETYSVGAISATYGVARKQPYPESETTLKSDNRLVISGDNFRFEDGHITTADSPRPIVTTKAIHISDGKKSWQYFPTGVRGIGAPKSVVWEHNSFVDRDNSFLLPLTFSLRGLDPRLMPFDLERIEEMHTTGSSDEGEILAFAIPGRSQTTTQIWLDPKRDYFIRRIRRQQLRKDVQIDIEYKRHESIGWLPDRWTCRTFSKSGSPLVTAAVHVTHVSINEPQPPELFQMEMSPGLEIYYRGEDKYYGVQPDGSLRLLGRDGRELPEPGPPPTWWQRNRRLVIGTGVVLVFVALLIWWLRRAAAVASK